MQPEDFESAAAMPAYFLTSCGHVLCGPCTNNNLTFCTKCGSSPIQMMAISDDMPDDIKVLFQDVGDSIKSIYKGNMFQSAHTEHLFEGMMKNMEQMSLRDSDLSSKVNSLTKELEAAKLEIERLKKIIQDARVNENPSRMRFYGAENSPVKRAARAFRGMATSPLKKGGQQRPKAPFEPKRRPDEASFPDGMSVHPLLTAKTPDELRKALVDPLNLGRPKPASEMPRGIKSPPYVRRLDMDAVERDESRKRTSELPRGIKSPPYVRRPRPDMNAFEKDELPRGIKSPPYVRRLDMDAVERDESRKRTSELPRGIKSPPYVRRPRPDMNVFEKDESRKRSSELPRGLKSPPYVRRQDMDSVERDDFRKRTAYQMPRKAQTPPRGRRNDMGQREALRKMAGSPPLNMFPW